MQNDIIYNSNINNMIYICAYVQPLSENKDAQKSIIFADENDVFWGPLEMNKISLYLSSEVQQIPYKCTLISEEALTVSLFQNVDNAYGWWWAQFKLLEVV